MSNWQRNINLKGHKAKGLGISFLPRGIYKVQTPIQTPDGEDGAQIKPNKKGTMEVLWLHHQVLEGYPVGDDGQTLSGQQDGSLTGQDFANTIIIPDETNPTLEADPNGYGSLNKAAEQQLKGAVAGHGNKSFGEVNHIQGTVPLASSMFEGRTAWLLYDPPKDGEDNAYPKITYLPVDKAQDFIQGKKNVPWPNDFGKSSGSATTGQPSGAPGGSARGFTDGPQVGGGPGGSGGPGGGPQNTGAPSGFTGSDTPANGGGPAQVGVGQGGGQQGNPNPATQFAGPPAGGQQGGGQGNSNQDNQNQAPPSW